MTGSVIRDVCNDAYLAICRDPGEQYVAAATPGPDVLLAHFTRGTGSRPRFRWVAAAGETLLSFASTSPIGPRDLLVYTADTSWTMPKAIWDSLRLHLNRGLPITVTLRGGVQSGASLASVTRGSSGDIGIAPVDAPGTIVYWTTTGVSQLKGFAVGDESVTSVLVPAQVTMRGPRTA